MRSSILIRYRFGNEGLSTTTGTIGLPRLARALSTLIGSCRIYCVFQIKAGRFRKRNISSDRFAKEKKFYYQQYSLKHCLKHARRIERYTSVDRR